MSAPCTAIICSE